MIQYILSETCFRKYGHYFLLCYCLFAALSIAASQIFVLLLIANWLLFISANRRTSHPDTLYQTTTAVIISWLGVATIASLGGINISRALPELFTTALYLLFPFSVCNLLTLRTNNKESAALAPYWYLAALIGGQCIAATHSLISVYLGFEISPKIPGPVTESGQLVLVIPLVIALVYSEQEKTKRIIWSLALALLFLTLVANGKRGPWLGVGAELVVLGAFLSRRILTIIIPTLLASIMLYAPAKERVFTAVEHFTIGGGRQTIWNLGIELLQRFPIGIGLDNAQIIRELDPSLPTLHRHMHNNLLNVAVETGWLGLVLYCWLYWILIRFGISLWQKQQQISSNRAVACGALVASCALLGAQTAGLVEYNFGDGEVRFIAFFIMGLLLFYSTTIEQAERA